MSRAYYGHKYAFTVTGSKVEKPICSIYALRQIAISNLTGGVYAYQKQETSKKYEKNNAMLKTDS
jgi:hypothetical protein